MALRSPSSAAARLLVNRISQPSKLMDHVNGSRFQRYFGDGSGRVLSEEERAKEAVYIQKMERERLEKLRKKMEKEKAEAEKSDKKKEEPQKA